jgi:hypothetical protein
MSSKKYLPQLLKEMLDPITKEILRQNEIITGPMMKSVQRQVDAILANIMGPYEQSPKQDLGEHRIWDGNRAWVTPPPREPDELPMPPEGSDPFTWLDYRRQYKALGGKMTYKMLAKLSSYAEGTFEQAACRWKIERGITQ